MKASPRQASSPDAAGMDDFESCAGSVSDCEHDAISLSSASENLTAEALVVIRGSSPGDILNEDNEDDTSPPARERKARQSQAFREVMAGAMEDSTSESSVDVPLKITLPARSQVKASGPKAASQKIRKAKASSAPESSAKATAPPLSKKTSATTSRKKAVLKVKADRQRMKGTSPSGGASDSPSQVPRAHRAKAPKPDFDHLANSVMFSVSEAGEKEGMDDGDKENGGDSTSESLTPPPRRRGRPPKARVSDLPEITEYSVSVYLEIERPPRKTSRKSSEPAENWRGGPVTVTNGTTWAALLRDIARAVKVEVGQLSTESLKWTTMADPTAPPKARAVAQWLPMTNEAGFTAFVSNGILATRGARTFLVKMSQPDKAPWDVAEGAEGVDGEPEPGDSDDEQPSKKKASKKAGDGFLGELAPFTEKLRKKYVIGACHAHPGRRCFYDKERNVHIHLVDNLLFYWANALHKKEQGVDYDNPPMDKTFFLSSKYVLDIPPHAQVGAQARGDQAQASGSYYPLYAPPQPIGSAPAGLSGRPGAYAGQQPPHMWGMSAYYPAPSYYPMMPPMYSLPPSMYAPAPGYPPAYPPSSSSYHPYPSPMPAPHHAHHTPSGDTSTSHSHNQSSPPTF